MKKVYLREDSVKSAFSGKLLPKFLFDAVKAHKTSLGNSNAFPNHTEYPFDYIVVKERYNEVCDYIGGDVDAEAAKQELSSIMESCKRIERPIRAQLERVCENTVVRMFAPPRDMIQFKVSLVDKVKVGNVSLTPRSDDEIGYEFSGIDEIEQLGSEVEKRRFIDSLIQGVSSIASKMYEMYADDINSIDDRLMPMYERINSLNDYLLFASEDGIDDGNYEQGSYVEVHLGNDKLRTQIEAQGLVFPLLLKELVRGVFELCSSQGLPTDIEKAKYVVAKADYVLSEPWDMRFGEILWRKIFNGVDSLKMAPYVFSSVCSIGASDFDNAMKEILSRTKRGDELIKSFVSSCEHDRAYQAFKDRLSLKNISKSVIADSYFTAADLDSMSLEDGDDTSVIEESPMDEALGNSYTFVDDALRGKIGLKRDHKFGNEGNFAVTDRENKRKLASYNKAHNTNYDIPTDRDLNKGTKDFFHCIEQLGFNHLMTNREYDGEYEIYFRWYEITIDKYSDDVKGKLQSLLNFFGFKVIKQVKSESRFSNKPTPCYRFCFEAVYGDEEVKNDIYLHATPTRKVKKILKYGLIPRDGKKLGYDRPDRIYLSKLYDTTLFSMLFDKDEDYTVLKIDLSKSDNDVRLYRDPLVDDEIAVYTPDTIPPQCISIPRQCHKEDKENRDAR